jgi:5'-nucleotidase
LPTIDPNEVTFIDFVKAGNQLSEELKNGVMQLFPNQKMKTKLIILFLLKGCDIIIALTHMRNPNDKELAKSCASIDIILGGHDHDYEITNVNDKYIIKSGTDFRQFSKLRIDPQRDANGNIKVDIEAIDVTTAYAEDMELKEELKHFSGKVSN